MNFKDIKIMNGRLRNQKRELKMVFQVKNVFHHPVIAFQ